MVSKRNLAYYQLPPHRHPLYEQVVDTFVPNDVHIIGGAGIGSSPIIPDDGNQWNSILLCTGANACGKVHCFVGSYPCSYSTFVWTERLLETGLIYITWVL